MCVKEGGSYTVGQFTWTRRSNPSSGVGHGRSPHEATSHVSLPRDAVFKRSPGRIGQPDAVFAVIVQPETHPSCVLIREVCSVANVVHKTLQMGMNGNVPQLLLVADVEQFVGQVKKRFLLFIELVQQSANPQKALVLLNFSPLEENLGEVLVTCHSLVHLVAIRLGCLPAGVDDDAIFKVDLCVVLDVHLGYVVLLEGGDMW